MLRNPFGRGRTGPLSAKQFHGAPGWQDVADRALSWATAHAAPDAADGPSEGELAAIADGVV